MKQQERPPWTLWTGRQTSSYGCEGKLRRTEQQIRGLCYRNSQPARASRPSLFVAFTVFTCRTPFQFVCSLQLAADKPVSHSSGSLNAFHSTSRHSLRAALWLFGLSSTPPILSSYPHVAKYRQFYILLFDAPMLATVLIAPFIGTSYADNLIQSPQITLFSRPPVAGQSSPPI